MAHSLSRPRLVLWLLLVWVLSVSITGCGGSGGFVVTDGGTPAGSPLPSPVPPATATIRLQSVLAREVPNTVDQVRLSGYDASPHLLYGPTAQGKAAVLNFEDVPISVTEVVLEYLDGEQVAGRATVAVELTAGEVEVIDDPDFVDLSPGLASLTGLQMDPETADVVLGMEQAYTVTGRYSDGSTRDLTEDAALHLTSSDAGVATIDTPTRTARALAPGRTTVTATFAGLTASSALTVSAATLRSLEVTSANSTIADGTSTQLTAMGTYTDGRKRDLTLLVDFFSSNDAVVSVYYGVARGESVGQVKIAASFQEIISAPFDMTVTDATIDYLMVGTDDGGSPYLGLTGNLRLVARAGLSNGVVMDVTELANWSSENLLVAAVDNDAAKGRVSGISYGQARISAAYGPYTDGVEVTVEAEPLTITSDSVYDTDTGTLNGEPMEGYEAGEGRLYTGVFTVASGVVLTIEGSEPFRLTATRGIDIRGNVVSSILTGGYPGEDGADAGDIEIVSAGDISGGGNILAAGGAGGAGQDGGDGGDVTVRAGGSVRLGALQNPGGPGVGEGPNTGGSAGRILLDVRGELRLASQILARGGLGNGADGSARGGDAEFLVGADLYLTGIDFSGGLELAAGSAGSGGDVTFQVEGLIRSSAPLNGNGGPTLGAGRGGDGGSVTFLSSGASLNITVSGGSTVGGTPGADGQVITSP